jgi:hypothetical protein
MARAAPSRPSGGDGGGCAGEVCACAVGGGGGVAGGGDGARTNTRTSDTKRRPAAADAAWRTMTHVAPAAPFGVLSLAAFAIVSRGAGLGAGTPSVHSNRCHGAASVLGRRAASAAQREPALSWLPPTVTSNGGSLVLDHGWLMANSTRTTVGTTVCSIVGTAMGMAVLTCAS